MVSRWARGCLLKATIAVTVIAPAWGEQPIPETFQEAPALAALVKAGKLPPVEERLPEEPLVVVPYEGIGDYGGSWLRMMKGTSDFHAYGRIVYDQMLRWAPNPRDGIVPGLVKTWTYSDGGRELTLTLRKGMRWSDGQPFTTDDIMFWWERIANDRNLTPKMHREWSPGGKSMTVEQIDDLTVVLRFAVPYPMAIQYLAFKGHQWPLIFERMGFFAPKHYLEPYLPTNGSGDPNTRASYALFEEKASDYNTERPVMSAWRVTEWAPGDHLTAERNPYYWKVDPAGNQLPYLDQVVMEIFLNPEMLTFRAVSGVLPMQLRHFSVKDIDLLSEFGVARGFRIMRFEQTSRDAVMLNLQYPDNEVLRDVFLDRRFRVALSLAIDRDMICKLCYRGLALPGKVGLLDMSPEYIEVDGLPDHYSYDPERASALLDEMGLSERDENGHRIGPDGETLSLIIETHVTPGPEMDKLEIVRSNWEAVGIRTTLKPEERTLYLQRVMRTGTHMVGKWGHEAAFPAVNPRRWFATNVWDEWGHHWAQWALSGGTRGVEPPPEVKALQQLESDLLVTTDPARRRQLWEQVIRSHAENLWVIPTTEKPIQIGVLANNFRNVPERAYASFVTMTPGNLNPETFYFESDE